jgi:hypothetical protein
MNSTVGSSGRTRKSVGAWRYLPVLALAPGLLAAYCSPDCDPKSEVYRSERYTVRVEVQGPRTDHESCRFAPLMEGAVITWEGGIEQAQDSCASFAFAMPGAPPDFAKSIVSSCESDQRGRFGLQCTGACTMNLAHSPGFTRDDVPLEDAELNITWTCGIEPPCVDRYTARIELVPRAPVE